MAVVKYNNELNKVVLTRLDAKETDIFYTIIYKMKEKDIATFSTQEIKSYMTGERSELRFFDSLKNVFKTQLRVYNGSSISDYHLFITKQIDIDKKEISIRIHPDCHHILNNLVINYTSFELSELISLRSEYSKKLFRLLMQFKNTGKAIFDIKKFRALLEIPINYKMGNIDQKVLKPCIKELGTFFENLKYTKSKNGKFVSRIEFSWKKNKKNKENLNVIEGKVKIEVGQLDFDKNIHWKNGEIEENQDYLVLYSLLPESEQREKRKEDLKELLKEHSFEYLESDIKYCKRMEIKKGFWGYLRSSVKNGHYSADEIRKKEIKKEKQKTKDLESQRIENELEEKVKEILNNPSEEILAKFEIDYKKMTQYVKGEKTELFKSWLNRYVEELN